jgi:putative endonuclease
MDKFYYVYVLLSKKDGNFYIGFTDDLKKRLDEHNKGRVPSTRNRTPLILIYYEACLNQNDAIRREKKLKTTWGRRFINSRLKQYLAG